MGVTENVTPFLYFTNSNNLSHSADYNLPNHHKAGKTTEHPLPLFYLPCL